MLFLYPANQVWLYIINIFAYFMGALRQENASILVHNPYFPRFMALLPLYITQRGHATNLAIIITQQEMA